MLKLCRAVRLVLKALERLGIPVHAIRVLLLVDEEEDTKQEQKEEKQVTSPSGVGDDKVAESRARMRDDCRRGEVEDSHVRQVPSLPRLEGPLVSSSWRGNLRLFRLLE